jgi:hypothetical protein
MQLKLGYSYPVTDFHQQVTFAARFLGKAVDANHIADHLFVVEREDKHTEAWTLAGCELRCIVDAEGEVHPYLYATHYGNTLEELSKCGTMRLPDPHWEIK